VQTQDSARDQRLEDKGVRLLIAICMVALLNGVTAGQAKAQNNWAPQSWVDNDRCSDWWVEMGAAGFDRPADDSFAVPLITNSLTGGTLLTAEDVIDLETTVGANLAFGGKTRGGLNWEFESTIAGWSQLHEIEGPDLESPFTGGTDVDNVDLTYDSDYYSLEVSAKRTVAPGLTLTLGPRYWSLDELLRLETDTTVTTIFGPFTALTEDDFSVRNSAIGLQLGFQFNQPVTQMIYVQGYGKFGGYNNHTVFEQRDSDNLGGPAIFDRLEKSTGSFLGEVGGKVYMDIVPGAIRSYVGYEATWIDGVALSPSQALGSFGVTDTVIETTNTLFFHQINFGFTITR
jgi:hypothetical protein